MIFVLFAFLTCVSSFLLHKPFHNPRTMNVYNQRSQKIKRLRMSNIDGPCIGIDLGSENSCVAIWKNNQPEICNNEINKRVTPSYVSWASDGTRFVGDTAKEQAKINPRNTIFGIQRLVGRKYSDPIVQNSIKDLPYKIVQQTDDKPGVEIEYKYNDLKLKTVISFEDVLAQMLRKLKEIAETHLGHSVSHAVITTPTSYDADQKQAIIQAGSIAGLKVEHILDKATAATVAYGLDRKVRTSGDSKVGDTNVLVVDIGVTGITIEATLLTISDGSIEVVATTTNDDKGNLDQRLKDCFTKLVTEAKIDKSNVNDIVLIGDGNKASKIQKIISKIFPGGKIHSELDSLEVGALGAATQGAILSGELSAVDETVLPLSIGIETAGGMMTKLMPRGESIPAKQSVIVSYGGHQSFVEITLFEGERMLARDNKVIGTVRIDDLPLLARGGGRAITRRIELTLDVNESGTIQVTAVDMASGKSGSLVITLDKGRKRQEEVERIILDAEENIEADQQLRAAMEARTQMDSFFSSFFGDL